MSDLINRKRTLEIKIRDLKRSIKNDEDSIQSSKNLIRDGGVLEPLQPRDIARLKEQIKTLETRIKQNQATLKTTESSYNKITKAMKSSH